MIIRFDNEILFEITEIQKKVIKNDILEDIFESDMMRRCKYWIQSPCVKFVRRNELGFLNKLKEKGFEKAPTDHIKLGAKFNDEFPMVYGNIGIKDKVCEGNGLSFVFSEDYQKIWRKILEGRWEKYFGKKVEEENQVDFLKQEKQLFTRRIAYILNHKYDKCFERMKLQWLPKLKERGIEEIPIDESEFAQLVFSQPDYMSRSQRDLNEDDQN